MQEQFKDSIICRNFDVDQDLDQKHTPGFVTLPYLILCDLDTFESELKRSRRFNTKAVTPLLLHCSSYKKQNRILALRRRCNSSMVLGEKWKLKAETDLSQHVLLLQNHQQISLAWSLQAPSFLLCAVLELAFMGKIKHGAQLLNPFQMFSVSLMSKQEESNKISS